MYIYTDESGDLGWKFEPRRGLQFADFMAGAIAARFEYARHQYLATPGLQVKLRKLYFDRPGIVSALAEAREHDVHLL